MAIRSYRTPPIDRTAAATAAVSRRPEGLNPRVIGLDSNVDELYVGDQVVVQCVGTFELGVIKAIFPDAFEVKFDDGRTGRVDCNYEQGSTFKTTTFAIFKRLERGTRVRDPDTGERGVVANDNSSGLYVSWAGKQVTGASHSHAHPY